MATEFDDQLRERLIAFQQHHGLTGDGVADTQTWTRLMGQETGGVLSDTAPRVDASRQREAVAEGQTPSVDQAPRLDGAQDEYDGFDQQNSDAEELQTQSRRRGRTEEEARALVDGHVVPRGCFIEYKGTREGWGPITGTGCAHWVAHQRGGPTGTAHVCQQGFKYRVTEVLASLSQISAAWM
jgi:hypothetical protein